MTEIHQSADSHHLLHISSCVRLSKCFWMSCSRTRENTTLMSPFSYICMCGVFFFEQLQGVCRDVKPCSALRGTLTLWSKWLRLSSKTLLFTCGSQTVLINQMLDSLRRSRSAFVVSDSPLQAGEAAVEDLSFAFPLKKKKKRQFGHDWWIQADHRRRSLNKMLTLVSLHIQVLFFSFLKGSDYAHFQLSGLK